jgi:hypothetical protein
MGEMNERRQNCGAGFWNQAPERQEVKEGVGRERGNCRLRKAEGHRRGEGREGGRRDKGDIWSFAYEIWPHPAS